jgi:hypothetical protein
MPRFCSIPSSSPYLVADLYGTRRRVGVYIHGGQGLSGDYRNFDEPSCYETGSVHAVSRPHGKRGLSPYILGRIRSLLADYQHSGRFTTAELRTMDALLYEGLTLRELAAREQVSDEAIRARLIGRRGQGGLLKKALEFARWWRFASSWRKRERRS